VVGPPSQGLLKTPEQQSASSSWIQIYSRALLSEAVSLGSNYKRKFSNTRVFRCGNGWYAIVMGPYEPSTAVETRDQLVGSGDIPRDSLVTRGSNFQQLAWGDDDTTGSTSSSFSERLAGDAYWRRRSRGSRSGNQCLTSSHDTEWPHARSEH
jgi:hypothetical protein